MKKYELTNETKKIEIKGDIVIFHRIKALKDFCDIKAGELGGWVEHEGNLSQEGACWIYHEAYVSKNARVTETARIFGGGFTDHVLVSGGSIHNGEFYDNVVVRNGEIYDGFFKENATITNGTILNGQFFGDALIDGGVICSGKIHGNARILGGTINGEVMVCENAIIINGILNGKVTISGNSVLKDEIILGNFMIKDNEKYGSCYHPYDWKNRDE